MKQPSSQDIQSTINAFRQFVLSKGWTIVDEKEIQSGIQITLEQRTHAEDDTAVAAASIVARAEFVRQIEQLSHQVGKTLPKGAWDPNIVKIGREIVAKGGQSELAKVAKLHFKITETILQS